MLLLVWGTQRHWGPLQNDELTISVAVGLCLTCQWTSFCLKTPNAKSVKSHLLPGLQWIYVQTLVNRKTLAAPLLKLQSCLNAGTLHLWHLNFKGAWYCILEHLLPNHFLPIGYYFICFLILRRQWTVYITLFFLPKEKVLNNQKI